MPRKPGDHGSALQAIEYAIDYAQTEAWEFLSAWNEGDLEEWPEFYSWLDQKDDDR